MILQKFNSPKLDLFKFQEVIKPLSLNFILQCGVEGSMYLKGKNVFYITFFILPYIHSNIVQMEYSIYL